MRFKNEAVVGLVVVLGLVVAVIAAFWLGGRPFAEQQREISAIFQQVGLLREGNPVVYRGVTVGRVRSIHLSTGGNGVVVEMEVSPDVKLPPNPVVVLSAQSFFGDWQAELTVPSAYPALQFTRAPLPGTLPGAALPDITQLTAVAARIAADIETLSDRVEIAFTEETALDIRRTVENVQGVSEQLAGFVGAQTQTFDAVAQNALQSSQNIQQTTARIDGLANKLEQSIDQGELSSIITNVQQASQNLERLTAQLDTVTGNVPGLLAQLDTTLTVTTRVISSLEPAAAELGPTLVEARQSLAMLQALGAKIERGEGTLGRLANDPALYEETQRLLAAFRVILADLQNDPSRYLKGFVNVF